MWGFIRVVLAISIESNPISYCSFVANRVVNRVGLRIVPECVVGYFGSGQFGKECFEFAAQYLYLVVISRICVGLQELVDSCAQFGLGMVEFIFGGGNIESNTGYAE